LNSQRLREGKFKCCREKWVPRHRCYKGDNTKKLYNCQAEKEEDSYIEETNEEEAWNPQNFMLESKGENTPIILLVSITSITQPQTLKLKGHVKKTNAMVLIYIRSSYNFVDINVARRLNLLCT
jgi:hypothetical protein